MGWKHVLTLLKTLLTSWLSQFYPTGAYGTILSKFLGVRGVSGQISWKKIIEFMRQKSRFSQFLTFMPISSSAAAATKKAAVKYLTYAKAGMSKNERYEIWLVKTSRIKEGINLRPKRLAFSLGRRLRNLILITKIDIKGII